MNTPAKKTPYDFQKWTIHETNRLLNASRNPLICIPTGGGKTFTACHIIKHRIAMKERIFILTPQMEIFNQWLVEFAEMEIDAGYINDKGVTGRNKKAYVCMPMSLNNLLHLLPESFFPDGIVTDECHRSLADTWESIYKFFPDAWRLGLTATPKRLDGKGLDKIYTDLIEPITMMETIDKNFISEPLLIVPESYLQEVPIQNGEYNTEIQAAALGKPQIIGDAIKQYGLIFAGSPVLVACCTFEHAKYMTEKFNEAGWSFDHIHSGLALAERNKMLRDIRNKKINGLCTVGIGIEGMDIPGLYGLIWLRRTMSITIYLQFIGRVLRKAKNKKYGIILDLVGNVFIHGKPEMKRTWTLQGDGSGRLADEDGIKPKMKICPICNVLNAEINLFCHICKFDFLKIAEMELANKRKFPAMRDGEIVVLDNEKESFEEIIKILAFQREQKEKIKQNKEKIKKISKNDKLQILKDGLSKKTNYFEKMKDKYL